MVERFGVAMISSIDVNALTEKKDKYSIQGDSFGIVKENAKTVEQEIETFKSVKSQMNEQD